ncbi:MAG: hypothetical protein ACP5N7_01175 [Candidatus Pacearchaeota archaeon]
MALFIRYISRKIRITIQRLIQKLIDSIIIYLPVYYKRLDRISLAKWFEIIEGKYIKLYKIRLTKRIPNFFYQVVMAMAFQTEHFDMKEILERADLAVMYSIAARTGNKSMKFQADSTKKQLEERAKKGNDKGLKLNDFIDYIEITFNQIGTIDPEKMSASRAFSLFYRAVEHNEYLKKQYDKMKK